MLPPHCFVREKGLVKGAPKVPLTFEPTYEIFVLINANVILPGTFAVGRCIKVRYF